MIYSFKVGLFGTLCELHHATFSYKVITCSLDQWTLNRAIIWLCERSENSNPICRVSQNFDSQKKLTVLETSDSFNLIQLPTLLTMWSRIDSTNGWNGRSTWYYKLVRLTLMVGRLRISKNKVVHIQSEKKRKIKNGKLEFQRHLLMKKMFCEFN